MDLVLQRLFYVSTGITLIVASQLKLAELCGKIPSQLSWNDCFSILAILLELPIAVCLVATWVPKYIYYICILLFALFSYIQAYSFAYAGGSCGCFGNYTLQANNAPGTLFPYCPTLQPGAD